MKGIIGVALASLALTAACAALAQDEKPTNVQVRVGLASIQKGAMRPADTLWPTLAVEFVIPKVNVVNDGKTRICFTYHTAKKDGVRGEITALTLDQQWPIDTTGTSPVYVGLGAGPYWLKTGNSGRTAVFGGKAFVGYNITDSVYLQGEYHMTTRASNRTDRGDAALLTVGYRF